MNAYVHDESTHGNISRGGFIDVGPRSSFIAADTYAGVARVVVDVCSWLLRVVLPTLRFSRVYDGYT